MPLGPRLHRPASASSFLSISTSAMRSVNVLLSHLCLLFTLGVGSVNALASESAELDKIIAIVDDDVIMKSELAQQVERARAGIRRQGTEPPPDSVLERQVMDRLILQKIQFQLAARTGVVVTEEALVKAVADIAKKNKLTEEKFREILASEGYDFNVFREDIRLEIILARLRREEVDKRVQVTDREVENYISNRNGRLENDAELKVSHILISIPSGATDSEQRAARVKAEEALARVKGGEDFSQVAIAMSDGQDALDGGDLGWRKANEIPSLFGDVVRGYAINQISDVITSSTGYHVIKLAGRRAGEALMVEQSHARHILVSLSDLVTDEEAINRLKQLRQRIESGDDFASIAKTHSDDRGSALLGGDLGWVSHGQMVPEFEEVMVASDVGELSPPFRSEFGWHILQVLERRKYDGTDEVLRQQARQSVMDRKREEAYEDWQRRLRDEAYVEMRGEK